MDTKNILEELTRRFSSKGLERVEECLKYMSGEKTPVYPHPHQEPTRLYFPGLSAKAWHDTADFPWVADIERSWTAVLGELQGLQDSKAGFFPYEDPYTLELGWKGWDTYTLYRKGKRHEKNAARCPQTIQLLEKSPRGVRQGMFTRLNPGAHLTPHTGGVNVVLTCHLGLIIPEGCFIRVGDDVRGWTPGKCLIFDDSFIHEVWHKGSEVRTILLWDIWHPDLTEVEIHALNYLFPIFDKSLRGGDRAAAGGMKQR
jgi:aspartyl/asparaginyl beta-hydroxylase (cupin superfamily)